MPVIIRRPRASADLIEIWEYIAADNMDAADALIDRIDAKFQAIAAQPSMGRDRSELAPALRSLPIPPYVIFYRPMDGGIEIVRVLHGARDIEAQFGGD
jgi:toxin ParE1/3/4